MRSIVVVLAVLGAGMAAAQTRVTFNAASEELSPTTASSVRLDERRLATIAVVGADPAGAHVAGGGAALELLGHDPVTRLTILEHAGAEGEGGAVRGSSLELAPGDAVYLEPEANGAPSRVVKWETTYQGKVLPVALIRVHHAGDEPPKPGAPLYNGQGEVVAICHQPAPQFGNGTFALPVEVITRVESDLQRLGRVAPCWIGVTVNASNTVLAIEMVRSQSPGGRAGLRKGDILLSIGPRRVKSYADARNAFYYLVSGKETSLEVLRGTQKLTLKVVPEVHPAVNIPGEADG